MKRIMFLSALLAATVGSWADNLRVADVTLPQNTSAAVEIELVNPNASYVSCTFSMQLPDGVLPKLDGSDPAVAKAERLGSKNPQSGYDAEGNIVKLAVLTDGTPFAGTSGVLFSTQIVPDGELPVGTQLTAKLFDITFVTSTLEKEIFDDVTFTITIGEPDDGRIHFNENATQLPAYTAGEKGDVTLARTIKAGQWSTIVLPFNLTKANATAVFGSNVEFAKFAGFEVDYGDDEENVTPLGITVNFTSYSIPARGNLAGGTPVLIKTSTDIAEIKLDDVTLTEGVKDVEEADEYGTPGVFTASLVKTTVPADGLFLADNKFWYSTGKTAIKAFRGWFELGAVLDKETDFGVKMAFVIDGIETVIDGMEDVERKQDEAVYDLSGRHMAKPHGKGVYIVGGRKVAVK